MEIEKNIPIPINKNRQTKYKGIVKKMYVGDSIFIKAFDEDIGKFADGNRKTREEAKKFANALIKLGRKTTMRIMRDDDGTLLGFRVWRIE